MDTQAGGETMYKVLLADDEILIRENIKKRIPWRDLGFELAASCERTYGERKSGDYHWL